MVDPGINQEIKASMKLLESHHAKQNLKFIPTKFIKELDNILEVTIPHNALMRKVLSLLKQGLVG